MLTEVLGAPAAEFVWAEPAGVGFLEVDNAGVYDDDYFRRYRAMSATPMAQALNGFRRDLVQRYGIAPMEGIGRPTLLDVGIGDGAFLRTMTSEWVRCYGADVNPAGIAYLIEQGHVVMSGSAEVLKSNPDVQDFYLGGSEHVDYRNVKHYRRRKRWLA